MDKKVTLTLHDGRTLEFPVLSSSIGPDVINIRTLYGKSGVFTYDPGFLSTASCNSTITYIDGDAGVLLYRGYPIEQLAQHCDFLEVCYLLLNGELPSAQQKTEFDHIVINDDFDAALDDLERVLERRGAPRTSRGFDVEALVKSGKTATLGPL